MEQHAQVFISCGQREDLGEVEVANAIANSLAAEGFEPYVAATQQTLRGLKENIFEKLEESEYFLFVDFARDEIIVDGAHLHRGSVFTQQELAIAAYLETDVIAFQEVGVRRLEGILGFMQANCLTFDDRSMLPSRVMDLVKERGWLPNWKKTLSINAEVSVHRNVYHTQAKINGDFYHLNIRNNHMCKAARDVYGYLDRVVNVKTGAPVEFSTVEFKWAGYTLPNAMIPAGSTRKLDAFWIPHSHPNRPQFSAFTDSTAFVPRIEGPGQWYLDYSVFSDTVKGTARRFLLTLNGTIGGVKVDTL